MEGQGSRRVGIKNMKNTLFVVIFVVMVIMGQSVIVQVESRNCTEECAKACSGMANPGLCIIQCLKHCEKNNNSAINHEPLYFCNLGCAISRCINLTSLGMKRQNYFIYSSSLENIIYIYI